MIPLATTTITVSRTGGSGGGGVDVDGYDPTAPEPTPIETHVRAVISTPSAAVSLAGGDRIVTRTTFRSDPADIQAEDTITDENDGTVWSVDWVRRNTELGFDFMLGAVRLVTGAT